MKREEERMGERRFREVDCIDRIGVTCLRVVMDTGAAFRQG